MKITKQGEEYLYKVEEYDKEFIEEIADRISNCLDNVENYSALSNSVIFEEFLMRKVIDLFMKEIEVEKNQTYYIKSYFYNNELLFNFRVMDDDMKGIIYGTTMVGKMD